MQSKPTQTDLGEKLREAVTQIEGVELLDRPSYYTVKVNAKTLGYVNGRKRIRVDFPIRDGKREQMHVEKGADVAKAIKRLRSYLPTEAEQPKAAATRTRAPKAPKAKATPKAK